MHLFSLHATYFTHKITCEKKSQSETEMHFADAIEKKTNIIDKSMKIRAVRDKTQIIELKYYQFDSSRTFKNN